jgi:hypothetical protein
VAGWKKVTARCVFSPQAEYAFVHFSAGRVLKAGSQTPTLGAVLAADVQLTLKVQPSLPVKIVQR